MSLQTMVTDDFHPLPSPNLPLNPETGVGWIAGDPTIGRVAN
jgi:hypothetical protein